MPSAHRFQSRLFQTIQAKFYQLQDTVQLRWRQLKVETVWGVQLSLYPLQVAFQTSLRSGRSLRQQVKKAARLLSVTLGLEAAATIDQPIRNVLAALDIQTLPVLNLIGQDSQSLELSAETTQWQLSIRPVATQKLSLGEKCGKLWQKWRGATQRREIAPLSTNPDCDLMQTPGAERSSVAPTQAIAIQGVASSLCHRRLVLVASGNRILDILTAEQQQQLCQRIIFEIAVALSAGRRLGAASPSLSAQTPPLALLKGAWRQIQQSARSVFQPSLAARSLLQGSETSALPSLIGQAAIKPFAIKQFEIKQFAIKQAVSRLKSLRGAIIMAVSAIALAPFTLALPARATAAPALPQPLPAAPLAVEWIADPARTRKQWLKGISLFGQSKPIQGKIRLVPDKAPAALSSVTFQTAIADWADRFSQAIPSSGRPPIDIDADFMGYHLHPLERLLMVVDQIMVWLETGILWLWRQGKSVIHRFFS
jgi:hypothetical protein